MRTTNDNFSPDLIVVGFGAAGAAAALRASELGAKVLVLEKQASGSHTPSSYMSGGHIMGVSDVTAATDYLDSCASGMVPRSISRAWAEKAAGMMDWLEYQGVDLAYRRAYGAEHPHLEGARGIEVYMPALRSDGAIIGFDDRAGGTVAHAQGVAPPVDPELATGRELFPLLRSAVEDNMNIEIRWGTPAHRLAQDSERRVTGVEILLDGRREVIPARAGVVLSCGGYEFDDQLKLGFLKAFPVHFYGNPGNTGDGVRMAQAVGADLWHMNQMIGRAVAHFEDEAGNPINLPFGPSVGRREGYVMTDRYGCRFFNEFRQAQVRHDVYYELLLFDPARGEYPRIPCYWIFDSRRIGAPLAPTNMGATGIGLYQWSADNRREIERGWIHEGSTVLEVARSAGIEDPEAAQITVDAYNAACESGVDAFGRPQVSLTPLDQEPFYCVPLYPGGSNSSGGPRRDEHARVLDPFGDPVPGLYAAGELGQPIGLLYPAGGCNLSEAFCFGQIAAETALAQAASTGRIATSDAGN